MKQPLILAIDTSCDETAMALTRSQQIIANVISSQINIHKEFGGVVPHLAKRAHQQKIEYVYRKVMKANKGSDELDAIAVTIGPGLAPALEVGVAFAKDLKTKLQKPLIAINHMEGHLLSSLAVAKNSATFKSSEPKFPALGLLVSGGHTELVLVNKVGSYKLLGQTVDDAAGEALDKLAKMLKLGYPGGPIIEDLAKKGNPDAISLPVPMQHSPDLNFSFSGLKTAALYTIQAKEGPTLKSDSKPEAGSDLNGLPKQYIYDICASFQKAVALSLTTKLTKAIKEYQPKSILLGGGVISNIYIRRQIRQAVKPFNLSIHLPYSKKLYTDNAAMIGVAAYWHFVKKDFVKDVDSLDRQPRLSL
jgi:N6-L-threonylcarbamoyladenine synthase